MSTPAAGMPGPAAAPGNMGPGQLPGSAPQQQASSPEALAKSAEPLLAQLKANPNNAEVLVQLGNLYYDGQSFPQAIDYYEKALKIQPNNADVRTDLGTATGTPAMPTRPSRALRSRWRFALIIRERFSTWASWSGRARKIPRRR